MVLAKQLKLVKAERVQTVDKVQYRRNRFIQRLNEQKLIIQAELDGTAYTATRDVYETDAEGNRVKVQRNKRTVRWFWQQDDGWYLQLRYGVRTLELAQNRNAIVVYQLKDLLSAIDVVQKAAENGELDDALVRATQK